MFGLTLSTIEIISYVGLAILSAAYGVETGPKEMLTERQKEIINEIVEGRRTYMDYSPTLGWDIKPHGSSTRYGYTANSNGVRGTKEYAKCPSEKVRVLTYGDSYTHSIPGALSETWQGYLEQFDSGLEVLNLGVGGYGLDQAYLRYLEKKEVYRSELVFVGFMPDNAYRNLNTFRPFLVPKGLPLAKPRFVVQRDRLVKIENPMSERSQYTKLLDNTKERLQKLGRHDYFYRYRYRPSTLDFLATYRAIRLVDQILSDYSEDKIRYATIRTKAFGVFAPGSEIYEVTARLIEQFYKDVQRSGAIPVVLFFPDKSDVIDSKRGRVLRYSMLTQMTDTKKMRHIDFMVEMAEGDIESLFDSTGHYTPKANARVARRIQEYLADRGLRGELQGARKRIGCDT